MTELQEEVAEPVEAGRRAIPRTGSPTLSLGKRLLAEGLGTALLLAVVVGSGIMGQRLSGGNDAVTLLANSLATGAGLAALILAFGSISGAHFNAVVTLAMAVRKQIPWREVLPYILVQAVGGILGVWITHYMFGLPVLMTSTHVRSGGPQWAGEVVATLGLLGVILGCSKSRPAAVPFAVGAYISAAYWFTSSTSFANPGVTLARAFTDTFSGIRPVDVPGFVVAQLLGAVLALAAFGWLQPPSPQEDP